MGSASSRMSASPVLVHSGRASDASASTVSTSTSTVSISTSTVGQALPSKNDTTPQPECPSTPPDTPPIVSMKLDKGKGKEIVEDKEEGEISEDETLPIHVAKPSSPSISSTKKSSPRPAYDSYRPQARPRGSSQAQYPPQYPRPIRSISPTRRMHQSQSSQQIQFPQQSQPVHFAQPDQSDQNGQRFQQHISKLSNGSPHRSPISPKTVEALSGSRSPMSVKPVTSDDQPMVPIPTPASTTSSPPENSLALPSSKSSTATSFEDTNDQA